MRKARLIKKFGEEDNQCMSDRILCEFHKTIELADVPPIGYGITYPEGKSIARFHVEGADIQSKSGNVTLYSTMTIQRYENWDYTHSIGIIEIMKEKGWTPKKFHKRIINVREGKEYHKDE